MPIEDTDIKCVFGCKVMLHNVDMLLECPQCRAMETMSLNNVWMKDDKKYILRQGILSPNPIMIEIKGGVL